MKISEFKTKLENTRQFNIQLPNGNFVPPHFHITEMGLLTKHFIDCGNTIRQDKQITFQVWCADDVDHRLSPEKVLKIINASKDLMNGEDLELEVEYQLKDTIGKFGLEYQDGNFILIPKYTTCLASDHCGIPADKMPVNKTLESAQSCCSPNSGCC